MAFIKNTERAQLIKATNKNYLVKKLLLLIDIVALVAFVVMVFVSWYMSEKQGQAEKWAWFTDNGELTTLGIGMVVFAAAVVVLGIVSVVLIFTIKSPKNTIKLNKKLESSALSGKKVYKTQTAGEVMRSRTTMKSNKKKGKK